MVKSLNYALRKYNARRKNTHYIIGFLYNDDIYVWRTQRLPHSECYMDNGNIRMRFSKSFKEQAMKYKTCIKWCELNELIKFIDKTIKCNSLGEAFERMITEFCGQSWEKDYTAYYDDNDLNYKDFGYSIKFATNCTIARQASLRG